MKTIADIDIFYCPLYGKLYEDINKAKYNVFEFECDEGHILYPYLKRPVPYLLDGIQYYDIMTPYGYGGPLIDAEAPGMRSVLLKNFEIALNEHCWNERIVAEFVRFHPILKNAEAFSGLYRLFNARQALATDLRNSSDPVLTEFDKSARKYARKARKMGGEVDFSLSPSYEDVGMFIQFYYENLDRVKSNKDYYFNEDFFHNLVNNLKGQVILSKMIYSGHVVRMGIDLLSTNTVFGHLEGTNEEGLKVCSNYLYFEEMVRWAKKRNFQYFYYGCGLSAAEDDGVFLFKKQFAGNTRFFYYQGARISNHSIYNRLCQISGIRTSNFFPEYRG